MTSRLAAALLATAVFATCTPASDAQAPAAAPKRLATKDGPREVAILGAGCFWGVEHWLMKVDGVVDIDVGYTGGKSAKASYEQVSEGGTGHAEAVRIVFDPSVTSYEDLLVRFYKIHDPTTKDRQGNDRGTQYRSAIFPTTDAQRKTAEAVTARVQKSGAWKAPITTTIEAPTHWIKAEEYHQDYLVKHPGGYDNHYLRDLRF
ncbi:MAG TPA: peptide-methionine (S)-S-oxide reductase MsrA [Kofleriaceae bacterium]|nr:peptide-methionine (S)-S-oxide reductase MsrA [Kofleriaceae bacterium]